MVLGTARGRRGYSRWVKLAAAWLSGWASLTLASEAQADDSKASAQVALGFSNLLARIDSDHIGFVRPEYRVHILEELRAAGFNAVGAENLVFNRDDAEKADLVLGGTVRELECATVDGAYRCRIGIEWQLLDRAQDRVVYRVLTRYMERGLSKDPQAAGKALTIGALHRLTMRPRFNALAAAPGAPLPRDDEFAEATFAECQAKASELPRDFEQVANGTVTVKSNGGFGSGFFLGPEGLVLTAAHVVSSGKAELRTRDGESLQARVVRISHKQDVALLSISKSKTTRPCLNLEVSPEAPGNDIYAIGAPASEELAFSLTRGIVSGLRTLDGVSLLQTDASLSPGNSGGALIDKNGRVVGVVSRKIAGRAVEGLGFAIPIDAALKALKLVGSAATSAELLGRPLDATRAAAQAELVDEPDPRQSLDPVGDRRRLEEEDLERRKRERAEKTPTALPVLRWGGVVVAAVGATVAVGTYGEGHENVTREKYSSLRTVNDVGWAAVGVGAVFFGVSFLLKPPLEPSKLPPANEVSVFAGPRDLKLRVSF